MFNQRLAVATDALFVCDKQVTRRAKAEFDGLVCQRLHDLDAVPCEAAACDCTGWKNVNRVIDDVAGRKIGEQSGPKVTDLLLVQPGVVVGKSGRSRPRYNGNAAIEGDFAVQAWGRVRAERVTQHGLAPLGAAWAAKPAAVVSRQTPANYDKANSSIVQRLPHLSHWSEPPILWFGAPPGLESRERIHCDSGSIAGNCAPINTRSLYKIEHSKLILSVSRPSAEATRQERCGEVGSARAANSHALRPIARQDARDRLTQHIANRSIDCTPTGQDVYHRILAVCRLDSEDLNAWMVRQGWALAFVRYSRTYVGEEASARSALRGMWSGAFIAPWDWRHRNRQTVILGSLTVPVAAQASLLAPASASGAPSPDCIIKGNVNRKGERIYHPPGGPHYAEINMNSSEKRWFCTEEEVPARSRHQVYPSPSERVTFRAICRQVGEGGVPMQGGSLR